MNEENETNEALENLKKPPKKNSMEDLFEVPKNSDNDMDISGLIEEPDMSDDLSDLTEVSNEDITGYKSKKKKSSEESVDMMPGTPANQGTARYRIQPLGSQQIRRVVIPVRPNTTMGSQNQ